MVLDLSIKPPILDTTRDLHGTRAPKKSASIALPPPASSFFHQSTAPGGRQAQLYFAIPLSGPSAAGRYNHTPRARQEPIMHSVKSRACLAHSPPARHPPPSRWPQGKSHAGRSSKGGGGPGSIGHSRDRPAGEEHGHGRLHGVRHGVHSVAHAPAGEHDRSGGESYISYLQL